MLQRPSVDAHYRAYNIWAGVLVAQPSTSLERLSYSLHLWAVSRLCRGATRQFMLPPSLSTNPPDALAEPDLRLNHS
jgi:hypothetical protein